MRQFGTRGGGWRRAILRRQWRSNLPSHAPVHLPKGICQHAAEAQPVAINLSISASAISGLVCVMRAAIRLRQAWHNVPDHRSRPGQEQPQPRGTSPRARVNDILLLPCHPDRRRAFLRQRYVVDHQHCVLTTQKTASCSASTRQSGPSSHAGLPTKCYSWSCPTAIKRTEALNSRAVPIRSANTPMPRRPRMLTPLRHAPNYLMVLHDSRVALNNPSIDCSPSRPDVIGNDMTIFTIGHSTRSIPEFLTLLRQVTVDLLVDVRSIPRSRTNPQFNAEVLPEALGGAGIAYRHLPALGVCATGQRERRHRSIHSGRSPPSGTTLITRQLKRSEPDWMNCEHSPVTIAAPSCALKPCGGAAIVVSLPTIC